MGILKDGLELVKTNSKRIGGLNGCRMLELGNQQFLWHDDKEHGIAAKTWFEAQGVIHTSIDLNGLMGALPLDLSLPINNLEWDYAFDMITDFGTSEHVGESISSLYNCRANCHRWCKSGGIMIYLNPLTSYWKNHGYHCFTTEHYSILSHLMGYKILHLMEYTSSAFLNGQWRSSVEPQVLAILVRMGDKEFLSEKQYVDICKKTVFPA